MALSLFKKSPDTDVEQLRSRRASLAAKLDKAQNSIQSKKDYVANLLIEDADPALVAKATKAVVEAVQDAEAHADAIGRLDAEIVHKTAEIAAAADRKLRDKTIAELERHESKINAAGLHLVEALRNFAAASDPVTADIPDARQLNALAKQLASEIPAATSLTTSMIRFHINNVKLGTAPATLAGHPAPVLTPKPAPIPTRRMFSMANLAWREGDEIKTVAKNQQTDLPLTLVEKATRLGFVIEMTDPRWKELSIGNVAPPHRDVCADLDASDLQPRKHFIGGDKVLHRAKFEARTGENVSASFVDHTQ